MLDYPKITAFFDEYVAHYEEFLEFEYAKTDLLNHNELAEKAPEEYRQKLTDQHERLSFLIYKIKEINDKANIIVSERLRKIQAMTSELDVYNDKGMVRREHAAGSAISKNV